MKITTLMIFCPLLCGQANTDYKIRAKPPQKSEMRHVMLDYQTWYEQCRQRLYDAQRDPGYKFSDLIITHYPDRRQLRADEVMQILDKNRKVLEIDSISLAKNHESSAISLDEVLYPQYFNKYTLSKEDWVELQRRAKEELRQGLGHPDVIAHWKSIAAGIPPFGLKVRE